MKNPIANPTAGLLYHWRALRYGRKLWLPFREAVEGWLEDWLGAEAGQKYPMLVLIGPSAGYTLPESFIARFSTVVGVDPDPAAAMLFQMRFRRAIQWVFRDFFDLTSKTPDPRLLEGLFSSYPAAVFLFCNVIGQLPVILRDRKPPVDVEKYMNDLGAVMSKAGHVYKIASYHDRFSRDLKRPRQAIDHLTGAVFASGFPLKKEFPWRLSPRLEHQIEFAAN